MAKKLAQIKRRQRAAININNQYASRQKAGLAERLAGPGGPGKDRRVKRINKPHRIAAKKGQILAVFPGRGKATFAIYGSGGKGEKIASKSAAEQGKAKFVTLARLSPMMH